MVHCIISKGIPVSKNTVYDILTNPFYYGLMYYDGKWIKHQYEPLINKELFERVQSILTQNGTHNRNNVDENAGKLYIFRGLIYFLNNSFIVITPYNPNTGIQPIKTTT